MISWNHNKELHSKCSFTSAMISKIAKILIRTECKIELNTKIHLLEKAGFLCLSPVEKKLVSIYCFLQELQNVKNVSNKLNQSPANILENSCT